MTGRRRRRRQNFNLRGGLRMHAYTSHSFVRPGKIRDGHDMYKIQKRGKG